MQHYQLALPNNTTKYPFVYPVSIRMPSKERLKLHFVEEFLKSRLEESGLSEKSISKYRSVLIGAVQALDFAGLNCYPRLIKREEILYLRQNHFVGNSSSHDRWKLSIFGEWLSWFDNDVLKKMKIPWPQDERISVDWLEPEDAIRMKRVAKGIERLMVHLELDLGLRRIDMYRLKMGDIHSGHFSVTGKGRVGGKRRTISWNEETPAIMEEYLFLRSELVGNARKRNPGVVVPDGLLIYQKGRRLGLYQMTAIDGIIVNIAKRAGIEKRVTNHMLRRTCGRLLYLSGVKIEEVADILGHSDTRTTLLYIGIRLDDQKKAFAKRDRYLERVESRMM